MTNPTVWHGTREEFWQLSAAAARYCACTRGVFGSVTETCPPHAMLLDQRVLDHLLYVYRSVERFLEAEWPTGLDSEPRGAEVGFTGGSDHLPPPSS